MRDGHNIQSTQSVVPYDENLLERARTQWQFGDWESLLRLDRDTLQHHPDRAKLALLAAAARLQTNQFAEARQLIRLAQEWGGSKKIISQLLIAGVHNTLGRVAAIGGLQIRAFRHFHNAIAIGTPGSETGLLANARAAEQFRQLGLLVADHKPETKVLETNEMLSQGKREPTAVGSLVEQQITYVEHQLKRQVGDIAQVKKSLETTVKKEIAFARKQLEAMLSIQRYFQAEDLIGSMSDWCISPDFALYLIRQLENKSYDLVIEFGSGTSTQLIAKVLANIAHRYPDRTKPVQVAFEHLEHFFKKSQMLLEQSGVANEVNLCLTPLEPYRGADGTTYSYYDCQLILKKLADAFAALPTTILALVDGPPGKTGPNARYPALPLLLQYFPNAAIDCVVDDFNRPHEKEVVKKWIEELHVANRGFEVEEEPLLKGACKLSIKAM